MARPPKAGLDYFPLDVFIDKDDDIELLEGKYGNDGFALLIKTYMKIYAEKGYYIEVNEKNITILGKRTNINFEKVAEILNDLAKWEIFDTKLYEEYNILTSIRVQKTYVDAAVRRKEIDIISEFLLLKDINANINLLQIEFNEVNANIKQTLIPKVKEIESKEKVKEKESSVKSKYMELEKLYPLDNSKPAQKKQAVKNYESLIKKGITHEQLLNCVKNYVKLLSEKRISSIWAISNFFGKLEYWKKYIHTYPDGLLDAWQDALGIIEWKPKELDNLKKLVDAGCLSRHAKSALDEGKEYFHGIGSPDGMNKVMKQKAMDKSLQKKSKEFPPLILKGGNYPI